MSSCFICGDITEFKESKICTKEKCEYKSRILPIDNYVKDMFMQNRKVFDFITLLSKEAILNKNDHFYNLKPPFENINETINEIKKNVDNIDLNMIELLETDNEIAKNFGPDIYGFLKFSLKANMMDIKPSNFITDFEIAKYNIKYPICFEIDYKDDKQYDYLFHGSEYSNWYSIFMNGLKNFSGTKNMKNGAAYGNGVYLTDEVNTAKAYSNKYGSKNHCIIGIFQLLDDKQRYKKVSGIYVVPDDKLLRLKYIIDVENSQLSKMGNLLNEKLKVQLVKEEQVIKQKKTILFNKRLVKEFERISKLDEKDTGFNVSIVDDDLTRWLISLKVEKDCELYKDLQKCGLETIQLEILFGQRYPIEPPFVRIVKPIFLFRTGHITMGGSICMELLTNQGWSAAYSIENLIVHIKSLIVEGEGRLDFSRVGLEYSMKEAKEAFERMRRTHGWK